jgi:hypothetical protein
MESVEEHCVLCDVRTICQAITAMSVTVSVFVCLYNNDGLHAFKVVTGNCQLLPLHTVRHT